MPTSAVGSGPPTLDEIRIAMEFIASQPRGESGGGGGGVVTEGFGAPSLSLPSPRGVQTPDAGALASSRAGRSSSSISLSGGGGGGPELELTLRDLLLFLQRKRTVAAEYSVGLVNRMFSEATEKAALTAVDLLNATKMGTFCADWAAVVRLALGSKLQHDLSAASRAASLGKPLPSPPSSRGGQHGTRGGTAPSPRGTFVRRSQPFHIPPSPRRRPQAGGSFTSTSPRSPRRAQQPQTATGAAAATATASRAALGAGTGSGAINNAKTSGRFLPLIRHPPWSVHADGIESPPDGFDRELVDDLGRTLHDVNALKAEIRRIEIEKARPNDQGIIFCGSSTSAISAVVVDVGHNSTPKFLRSCHVPKGPSNLTIEEVVSGRNSPDHHGGSSPSLSPHKAGRPLTQRQKDALRRQQVAAEEEMYQNVLSKIVNYLS